MTTTPETIAELKRLLAEATPGPWTFDGADIRATCDPSRDAKKPFYIALKQPAGGVEMNNAQQANCQLIAAAVNALPSLLSDLEAAQKREQVLREALVGIFDYWNREENHKAMADACYHTIDAAHAALAATEGK